MLISASSLLNWFNWGCPSTNLLLLRRQWQKGLLTGWTGKRKLKGNQTSLDRI